MGKHTPGPWRVGPEVTSGGSLVYIQILPENGYKVSSVSVYQYDNRGEAIGKRDKLGNLPPGVPSPEVRANAKLIAAAPEMASVLLEALELCEDNYDTVDGEDGQPSPNKWMQLGQAIEDTLKKAGAL